MGNNVGRVNDLMNGAGNWLSSATLAETISISSVRYVSLLLCGLLSVLRDKNLHEEQVSYVSVLSASPFPDLVLTPR